MPKKVVNYTLLQIKRMMLQGNYQFTLKADLEMAEDHLTAEDVVEAIANAPKIDKVLNSNNPFTGKAEKLYVIKGHTYDNLLLYTKGKIVNNLFYVLISSKRAL